jgi:hypothetical protein
MLYSDDSDAVWRALTGAVVLLTLVGVAGPAAAVGTGWGVDGGPAPTVGPASGDLRAGGATGPAAPDGDETRRGAVQTATVLSSCTTIDRAGTYELVGNLSANTTGTCLAVNASNVTVEGNGNAMVGNGSGVAVGTVSRDLDTLTVRNLHVRDWQEGIDLFDAGNVTVANASLAPVFSAVSLTATADAVVRDVHFETTGGGVRLVNADRADVRNVSGVHRSSGGSGLSVANARDATVRNVTLTGDFLAGINAAGSETLRLRAVTTDGVRTGLDAEGATGLDARDVVVAGADLAFQFRPEAGQSSTFESGTLERATVRDPAAGGTYVTLDGSNGLDVRNLSTPNGTVSFNAVNVSLERVGSVPPAPADEPVAGAVGSVAPAGADPVVALGVHYPRRAWPSTVDPYRLDAANGTWQPVPTSNVSRAGSLDAVIATTTVPVGGVTVGAFGRPRTIAGCTAVNDSGVYEFTSDVSGAVASGSGCLRVNASDVTVDGNGHALTGDGNGTALAVVRDGLSNVTVRTLSIAGYEAGVDLARTTDASARNLSVETDFTGVDFQGATAPRVRDVETTLTGGTGVTVNSASGAVVRNVTAVQTSRGGSGVGAGFTTNATLVDVDVEGAFFAGIGARDSETLTVRSARFDGPVDAVSVPRGRNLSVADVRVLDATTAVRLRPPGVETGTFESGTISDVTVDRVRTGASGTPPRYLVVDGSNTATTTLSTPNATTTVVAANASLRPVGAVPPAPEGASLDLGRVNVTREGPGGTAILGIGYDPGAVEAGSVGLYRLDAGNDSWRQVPAGNVTVDPTAERVTTTVTGPYGVYGAFGTARTVSACTTLNESGTYRLSGDLAAPVAGGETCIAVNASDVTVDGRGHAVTGNGSGVGIGVVRAGLSNVTVRNVTVDDYFDGVYLRETPGGRLLDATVTVQSLGGPVDLVRSDDAVVRNVTVRTFGDGVAVSGAARPTVRDVRVVATSGGGVAVAAVDTGNATLANVTAIGPYFGGIDAAESRDLRVTDSTLRNATTGLDAPGVRNLSGSGLTVRNTTTALEFRDATRGGVGTVVETATLSAVSVTGLEPDSFGTPPAFLRVDGTSDVSVGLDTPNASATVAGSNLSVRPVGATPSAPRAVTAGRIRLDPAGPDATAVISIGYPAGTNDSTVGLYRVDGGRWSSLPAGSVTVDTTTRTVGTNVSGSLGTYGAFAGNVSNGTGNGSLPLGARLFPNGIPAGTGDAPPTDTDGDGLLEDLDGNGAFEFVDVIEFVFALQRGDYSSTALSSAQIAALDLDSNGRVTFVDVIALVFEI